MAQFGLKFIICHLHMSLKSGKSMSDQTVSFWLIWKFIWTKIIVHSSDSVNFFALEKYRFWYLVSKQFHGFTSTLLYWWSKSQGKDQTNVWRVVMTMKNLIPLKSASRITMFPSMQSKIGLNNAGVDDFNEVLKLKTNVTMFFFREIHLV